MATEVLAIGLDVDASWLTNEDLGMAGTSHLFAWNPSSDPKVVGYRLRVKAAPAVPTLDDPPIELGKVLQFDSEKLAGLRGLNGTFNLVLTSYKGANLESDFSRLDNVPLDLVPPDAPTNFRRL